MQLIKADNIELLNFCLGIRKKVFQIEKGVPKEIEIDEYDCLNSKVAHYLIEDRGVYIGTIRMNNLDNKTIKIQRFCFLKEFRGLGYGKKVVFKMIENYSKLGFEYIEVGAKFEVKEFYKTCGFDYISEPFFEANIKHIEMKRKI